MTQCTDNAKMADRSKEMDMNKLHSINQKYDVLKKAVFSSKQALAEIIDTIKAYIHDNHVSTASLFGYKRKINNKTHDFQWTETERDNFLMHVAETHDRLSALIKEHPLKSNLDEIRTLCESLHFCRKFICNIAQNLKNSNQIQFFLNDYNREIEIFYYNKSKFLDKIIYSETKKYNLQNSLDYEIEECVKAAFIKAIEKYNPKKAFNDKHGKTASFETYAAIQVKDAIKQKFSVCLRTEYFSLDDENNSIRLTLQDNSIRPDEYMEMKELHNCLSKETIMNMNALNNKDKLVILLHNGYISKDMYSIADLCKSLDISVNLDDIYFGNDDNDNFTFDEIGTVLHVSKQCVQQRMKHSIKTLSEHFRMYYC